MQLINLHGYIHTYVFIVDDNTKLAVNHLHKTYGNRHIVSIDEWPPYQPKHYTTLALIHVEKHTSTEVISVTKELASRGKIENKKDSILKHHDDNICYQSKSIAEIFSSDMYTQQHSFILIEGAPGIGKTILSKEIAYQWANQDTRSCVSSQERRGAHKCVIYRNR